MTSYSVYLLNTFFMTVVLVRLLARVSPRLGLIDLPDSRKTHGQATPVVGGIAIFTALAVTWAQMPESFQTHQVHVLPGLALLVATGVVDDRNGLGAVTKLILQTGAATAIIVPGKIVMMDAGGMFGFGVLPLGIFGVPLTVLLMVVLINAFNLIDGIDGAAGGISVVAIGWLAYASAVMSYENMLVLALVVLFAVLGFLVYNIRHPWRARAEVFLGDAGSMTLGATVGVLAILICQATPPDAAPGVDLPVVSVLWIVALPCIDMLSLFVRRILDGVNPFAPDRRHIHHLMLDSGLSVTTTAFVMIACSVVLGSVGVFGWQLGVPEPVLFVLLLVPMALHAAFVARGRQAISVLRGAKRHRAADKRRHVSPSVNRS